MLSTLIHKLRLTPVKIILADVIGALISASLLFLIFICSGIDTGIPENLYYILCSIALVFFFHSGFHYLNIHNQRPSYLKIIAILNLLYCCFTAILMIAFIQTLTLIELVYLAGEILLIGILSAIELRLSQSN